MAWLTKVPFNTHSHRLSIRHKTHTATHPSHPNSRIDENNQQRQVESITRMIQSYGALGCFVCVCVCVCVCLGGVAWGEGAIE